MGYNMVSCCHFYCEDILIETRTLHSSPNFHHNARVNPDVVGKGSRQVLLALEGSLTRFLGSINL